MSVFLKGGFGNAQRLSTTGFIILGLLTFWVYSVIRFAKVLNKHFQRRWADTVVREDLKNAEQHNMMALYNHGFNVHFAVPYFAAALFLLDALLVLRWFILGIILGQPYDYWSIIITIGITSMLFYFATAITMLWALITMRRHEITELLLTEQGALALELQKFELGSNLLKRWEHLTNSIALFLIIALPISFSPTICVYLFYANPEMAYSILLPIACFILAAIFHIWGTSLLVNLYNQHLDMEKEYSNRKIKNNNGKQPERELVAIMLTDMCGYSKQMEQDEALAYTKLLEHNQIIRAEITKYRGREIKTIGDAFLVTFRSAIDAVDCALAIQRSFTDFNGNRPEKDRILIRIGIHLGDVLIVEDDVYGDGVNVAARIEPLAEPGGICVSEPVFEMVRKKIQLDVQRLNEPQLKNIETAPNIYKIYLGG